MTETPATPLAHGATLVGEMLAILGSPELRTKLDPAHADRFDSVEEAARLLADAAQTSPRSLRASPVAAFRKLIIDLALEVEDPGVQAGAFEGEALADLETERGTVSAGLMGLYVALGVLESGLPGERKARSGNAIRVWVPRDSLKAWSKHVVSAVSRLESEVLRRRVEPAMAREAWTLAVLASVALAHVTDHASVDAKATLDRLAEAGDSLSRAVALRASQAAAGRTPFGGAAERACLDMVAVVEDGIRLVQDAYLRREDSEGLRAWRSVTKGRTRMASGRVAALVPVVSEATGQSRVSIRRGVKAYQSEWAA